MIDQGSVISVFGSSQAPSSSPAYEEAKQVGKLLALEGLTVCSGGYGGVMEAVSRGAKEAGGPVIGVTTSWFRHLTPNRWVDREIRTETFLERLETLIKVAQGCLALKGGIGTLTEITTVWSLLQTHSIAPKPFVLLSDPWKGLLDFCGAELIIRQRDLRYPRLATTAAEAVRALVESLGAQAR